MTFEFDSSDMGGQAPRFELAPVEPPFTKDPSDEPMTVDGRRFFRIIFHGASGYDLSSASPHETYTGPEELHPGLPSLIELEQQGDFEATLSWIFGLERPGCPRVTTLKSPLRVAIDFPN